MALILFLISQPTPASRLRPPGNAELQLLYPNEVIALPENPEGDLEDIPKLGHTGVTSLNDPIGQYPENQKRFWGSYYATITFMDEQVGRIMAELDRLGLRESTIVVFTSDHGYHLGEHFFWQKQTLFEEVTRVPFIISAPGFAPGDTHAFAELVDIYPTVLELVGLPVPDSVLGRSLVTVLADPAAAVRDEALTVGHRQEAAIRGPEWTYMRYRDGSEQLYDMVNDPRQFTNLASDPAHATTLAAQRARLAARLAEAQVDEPSL